MAKEPGLDVPRCARPGDGLLPCFKAFWSGRRASRAADKQKALLPRDDMVSTATGPKWRPEALFRLPGTMTGNRPPNRPTNGYMDRINGSDIGHMVSPLV